MQILTKFDIKETVWIKELKTSGVVLSIYLGDQGLQYNVRYFHNGEAKTVYFFEDELKSTKESPVPFPDIKWENPVRGGGV